MPVTTDYGRRHVGTPPAPDKVVTTKLRMCDVRDVFTQKFRLCEQVVVLLGTGEGHHKFYPLQKFNGENL